MQTQAYIALGSNQETPREQLKRALAAIAALPGSTLIKASSFYETKPMGYEAQENFVNAVVLIETNLAPLDLLHRLHAIERAQGRIRTIKNGPRTLDCDLILFGDREISSPELTLPHPGLTSRDFVLQPLLEISPDCTLPKGQPLRPFLEALTKKYCV